MPRLLRMVLALVVAGVAVMLVGCGGAGGGTGSLLFHVDWATGSGAAPAVSGTSRGGTVLVLHPRKRAGSRALSPRANSVEVVVLRGESQLGRTKITLPATSGTILGIPAGNYMLYAAAYDVDNWMLADGSVQMTVSIGQNAVTILLSDIPLPTVSDHGIFIADTGNHRIVRVDDISGANWQAFGSQGMTAGVGQFDFPYAVVPTPYSGLYVADGGNGRIENFAGMSVVNWTLLNCPPSTQATYPVSLAVTPGQVIYTADLNNHRLLRFASIYDTTGTALGGPTAGSGVGQFNWPSGVCISPTTGNIFVADALNNRIVRLRDITGSGWTTFGTQGSGQGNLHDPAGVCAPGDGSLYIADTANNRIVQVAEDFTGWTAYGDGTKFANPGSVAVANGHIYIADVLNSRIVQMDNMSGANFTVLTHNPSNVSDVLFEPCGVTVY